MEMTAEALRNVCKERSLYRTPSLNDTLYANHKGFTNIGALDPYTGLKALYLEGNAIDSLLGLPRLESMKCLFVQQNMLWRLEGLEQLPALDTLNVSSNNLTSLDGLQCCSTLATIIATHNSLEGCESIAALASCSNLTTVDLQSNKLEDPEILSIFQSLPELRCLYLTGNPVVAKIKNYRKTLVATLPKLSYLDDRPVFETERRCAEAWLRGGVEAEREERVRAKREEMDAERRNFEAMLAMRKEGFRKRREAMGLAPGDTDPYFDNMSDTEWEPEKEPEELIAARQQLAQYEAREGEEEPPELAAARQEVADAGTVPKPAASQPVLLEGNAGEPPSTPTGADRKAAGEPPPPQQQQQQQQEAAAQEEAAAAAAAEAAQAAAMFQGHQVAHVVAADSDDEEALPQHAGVSTMSELD